MLVNLRTSPRMRPALAGAVVAALGAIASFAVTALSGTKTGLALALASIAGPIAIYAAVVAPLVFPFTFYVLLVPFDNILDVSSFGTLTKLLAMASGLAIIFFLARTRRLVKPSGTLLVWAGFLVWSATTAFWAVDPGSVWLLLPTAAQLLVLYAGLSVFPTDRKIVTLMTVAAVAGGTLAAVYGAYMFRHGMDVSKGGRLLISSDTSSIDPNHFGASLLLPIGLALGIALYARKPWIAIGAIVAMLVMLEGVAITESRGAILGIIAMVIYFLVRSERRIRLAVALIPLGIVAILTQPQLPARFATALTSGGSGRVDIWKVGIVAFKQHWLLGAGYNNFAFAYDQAFLQAHQEHFSYWHRAPHNLLLNTGVELGIVGLALLLAAWVAQFLMLRNVPKEDPDYAIRLGLEAAVIATFVGALFLDIMVMKYLWLTFTIIAIVRNAHVRRPIHA